MTQPVEPTLAQDAPVPTVPPKDRPDRTVEMAELLGVYHSAARGELIVSIERRDSSLFLYLAAVGTIFSISLANYPADAPMLLVVPLLGLGASLVHSQHNTVVGAIGHYLASEFHEATVRCFGPEVPPRGSFPPCSSSWPRRCWQSRSRSENCRRAPGAWSSASLRACS